MVYISLVLFYILSQADDEYKRTVLQPNGSPRLLHSRGPTPKVTTGSSGEVKVYLGMNSRMTRTTTLASTCYQCTWSNMVIGGDSNETSRMKPNKVFEPLYGRQDFDSQMSYSQIKESCKVCKMEFGGSCVKWSYFEKDKGLLNVTRFCGWTPHTTYGCFEQKISKEIKGEVCFCDGENCNSSVNLSAPLLLNFIVILPVLNFMFHIILPRD